MRIVDVWHVAFLRTNPCVPSRNLPRGYQYFLSLLKALDLAHAIKKEDTLLPRHQLQSQLLTEGVVKSQPGPLLEEADDATQVGEMDICAGTTKFINK